MTYCEKEKRALGRKSSEVVELHSNKARPSKKANGSDHPPTVNAHPFLWVYGYKLNNMKQEVRRGVNGSFFLGGVMSP